MTMQKNKTELLLFSNSIGTIKEQHFSINGIKPDEIPIQDVVFIELRHRVSFTYNKITGLIAGVLLLYGLVLHFSYLLSLIGLILLCVSMFLHRKMYYLQVTFKAIEVSFTEIAKNQKADADIFIEKFYSYKSFPVKSQKSSL